jgi:hypothetical protein
MKEILTNRLDQASLDYLTQIERTAGRASNGVFIRPEGTSVSPRAKRVLGLLAGLAVTAVAVAASWLLDFERTDPRTAGHVQAALLAVGLGLSVGCTLTLRRSERPSAVGRFLWADARHLWQVTPDTVQVLPLDQLGEVARTDWRLQVRTPAGPEAVTLPSLDDARRLEEFLQALRQLRQESKKSAVAADAVPELLGALAVQVAQRGAARALNLKLDDLQPGLPLPVPEEVAPVQETPPRAAARLLPWGVAAAAGLVAFLVLPGRNNTAREERLHAATADAKSGSEQAFERYLAVYPSGWRSDEMRARWDDWQFEQARKGAEDEHRVGKVRAYLADARNQRHRADAEELLKTCERHLFERVKGKDDRDLTGIDAYLKEFAEGARAAEVLVLRDDRVFARAADRAKQTNDPADLRAYLADARHTRHRKEAGVLIEDCGLHQARAEAKSRNSPAPLREYLKGGTAERHRAAAKAEIAKHYDAAIERLKGTGKGKKVDEKLFQLLVALLDGLKSADTPVVKARFQGTNDPLPKNEFQKAMEKFGHTQYEKTVRAIKAMAEQSPDKTAILPHGDAFSPEHTARRERLILELLRRSLAQVLSEELLKLEHAAAGEAAAFEVAHHTFAGGMLFLFTTTQVPVGRGGDDPGGPVDPNAPGVTVHGLLRGYEVNWGLKVAPVGAGKGGHDYKFHSRPAQRLGYRRSPSDPSWAPTAVIMHSGSYEMSSKLIGKLGLPEPLTPTSFSFLDATDTERFGVVVLSEQGVLKDRNGEVAYEVRLEAGRTYRIDAESGAFDTFLRLESPGGQTVASNDDVDEKNLNSRIVYRAAETGTYRLIVSCFDKQRAGPFLLTVQY